jgi:hypothetical protein
MISTNGAIRPPIPDLPGRLREMDGEMLIANSASIIDGRQALADRSPNPDQNGPTRCGFPDLNRQAYPAAAGNLHQINV